MNYANVNLSPAVDTLYSEIENKASGSTSSDGYLSPVETPYSGLEYCIREPTPEYLSPVETPPYFGLESSTREPPQAPAVCATLFSEREKASGSTSSDGYLSPVETPYSRLKSSTREPPPAPYAALTPPEYVNINGATGGRTSGTSHEEQQSDSGMSSNINSSSASYSRLDPSTREPPQPPVIYDRLTRHHYVND